MRVVILLADAAQEVGGKLYILGGGWSICGFPTPPSAIAARILVPWSHTNRPLAWTISLLDQDGQPVGEPPIRIEGQLEVGRPPGTAPGSELDAAIAVTIPPGLPLEPGKRYEWRFEIDDAVESANFKVRG